jgi:hypothetical protein
VNPWSNLCRRLFTPVDVQNTVPPADVVPTRDEARRRFLAESAKPRDERDMAEIQRCLDAVGEHPDPLPPLGIRYAAPVIPGRAS